MADKTLIIQVYRMELCIQQRLYKNSSLPIINYIRCLRPLLVVKIFFLRGVL